MPSIRLESVAAREGESIYPFASLREFPLLKTADIRTKRGDILVDAPLDLTPNPKFEGVEGSLLLSALPQSVLDEIHECVAPWGLQEVKDTKKIGNALLILVTRFIVKDINQFDAIYPFTLAVNYGQGPNLYFHCGGRDYAENVWYRLGEKNQAQLFDSNPVREEQGRPILEPSVLITQNFPRLRNISASLVSAPFKYITGNPV